MKISRYKNKKQVRPMNPYWGMIRNWPDKCMGRLFLTPANNLVKMVWWDIVAGGCSMEVGVTYLTPRKFGGWLRKDRFYDEEIDGLKPLGDYHEQH